MLHNITFSPTGGVFAVADILAKGLGEKALHTELCVPESARSLPQISKEDTCIIAVPSFGGRVPLYALSGIQSLSAHGAVAILVCVYGNRAYEDTLSELFDASEKAGFRCIGAVCAVAEHSVARQFAKGRPDDVDKSELCAFSEKIKEKLMNKDYTLHSEIRLYHEYKERSKSKFVPVAEDGCTMCGICARGCPSCAISIENPKETNAEKCISCMKCTSVCPTKARAISASALSAVSEKLCKVCSDRKGNELFL